MLPDTRMLIVSKTQTHYLNEELAFMSQTTTLVHIISTTPSASLLTCARSTSHLSVDCMPAAVSHSVAALLVYTDVGW